MANKLSQEEDEQQLSPEEKASIAQNRAEAKKVQVRAKTNREGGGCMV